MEEEREHLQFRCGRCHRAVQNNHRGIRCDQCNNWFHLRCVNVSASQYRRLSNSSEWWLCNGCHGVTSQQEEYGTLHVYTRCQRDKHNPKFFSAANDMDPGSVPPCLQGISQIEELLITHACPIMTVYHKHGGQLGYSGYVLNLPQNIQQFNKLLMNINDLPVLTVLRQGRENIHRSFRVRRYAVLHALQWLKHNNKYYTDI